MMQKTEITGATKVLLTLVMGAAVAGCGSSSTPQKAGTGEGVPTVEHTSDGYYVARVKDQETATTICGTKQAQLAQQLKGLGAASGSGALILFQYGDGDPAERLGNPLSPYAVADGNVITISPTLTICGVTAK